MRETPRFTDIISSMYLVIRASLIYYELPRLRMEVEWDLCQLHTNHAQSISLSLAPSQRPVHVQLITIHNETVAHFVHMNSLFSLFHSLPPIQHEEPIGIDSLSLIHYALHIYAQHRILPNYFDNLFLIGLRWLANEISLFLPIYLVCGFYCYRRFFVCFFTCGCVRCGRIAFQWNETSITGDLDTLRERYSNGSKQ